MKLIQVHVFFVNCFLRRRNGVLMLPVEIAFRNSDILKVSTQTLSKTLSAFVFLQLWEILWGVATSVTQQLVLWAID